MQFSLSELMSVMVIVSITAASVLRHVKDNLLLAAAMAVSIGLAASGPWLLGMRMRSGKLTGRWGIGEIVWFSIGVFFAILVLWNLLLGPDRSYAQQWLMVGGIMCFTSVMGLALIGGARALTSALGADLPSERDWFVRRGTNFVGIAVVVGLSILALVLISEGSVQLKK